MIQILEKRIQEETKNDKVHSGKGINVNKDLKDEESQSNAGNKDFTEEEIKKRYFTIECVKDSHKNIDIKAEKVEKINESNSKGRNLDTIK